MWHKGIQWHYVESDILKERQIPSVKMLFKTNTKSHKHPSITLFIIEQNTIAKLTKTKSGIKTRNRALPERTVP